MKFFRKGQTATEYLIILAVVIVIALVVVVAMGKFPGIGQGASARGNAAFWAVQDLAITDYAISSNGNTANDVIVVKNNMRSAIDVTEVQIGGTVFNAQSGDSFPITLSPGGVLPLEASADLDCAAGQGYVFSVQVNYTDRATNAEYGFTGAGQKLEGTCAN